MSFSGYSLFKRRDERTEAFCGSDAVCISVTIAVENCGCTLTIQLPGCSDSNIYFMVISVVVFLIPLFVFLSVLSHTQTSMFVTVARGCSYSL